MNERIEKLALQAEEYALSVCDNNGHFHRIYREKFAELIVRGCAGVSEVSMPITSHPDDRLIVKNSVLKHFGVEE